MLTPSHYNKENNDDDVSSVGSDRTIVASNVKRVSLSPGEKMARKPATSDDLDFLLQQIPDQIDRSLFVRGIFDRMEAYAQNSRTLHPSTISDIFFSFVREYDGDRADIEHHGEQINLHFNTPATHDETMSLLRGKVRELDTNAIAAAQDQPRPANADEGPANADEGPANADERPPRIVAVDENGSQGSSSVGSNSAGRRARENQNATARPPLPRATADAQQPHAAPDARQPRAGIGGRAFLAVSEGLNHLAGNEDSSSELRDRSSVGLCLSESKSTE